MAAMSPAGIANATGTFMFVLNSINDTDTHKQLYLAVALTAYLFTVFVNLTLIVTICLEKALHEPMYFFVCNLCVNAMLGANTFYPRFIFDLSTQVYLISYYECLLQVGISLVHCKKISVICHDNYFILLYTAILQVGIPRTWLSTL